MLDQAAVTAIVNNQLQGIGAHPNEPLAHFTNTRTGGPADWVLFPKSPSEARKVVTIAHENDIPLTVLGNASNLIVSDNGIRGIVLILTKMNEVVVRGNRVIAQAGATMIATTEAAYHAGLTGLEFASGIPGSVGGAVFMNAGAYGGEMKMVVEQVTAITRNGALRVYSNRRMDFGYRHSRVQDADEIVLDATFALTPGNPEEIRAKRDHLNFLRAAKQPLEYPSCGSVFKRPEGHYTGKLVHDAGLQGYRVGGAEVSTKHAGFIVNVGNATAADYVAVIRHVQQVVKEKFDVELETEVRIIGD